jgi:hypothetical protein
MPKGAGCFSAKAWNVPILPIFREEKKLSKNDVDWRKSNPDNHMALNTSAPKSSDA